jgi:hypothetical protein
MGFKLSIGLGIALVALSGAFKLYYDKSQAELESFKIRLEQSIQKQNDNLKETIENQKLMVAQVERLTKESQEAQEEVIDIRKKWSKHNLNVISMKKPGLIEKIINKGTAKVGEELEQITNPDRTVSSI